MSDADVHGPVDFLLMEFPGDRFTGEIAAEVSRLVDAGIVRLYDVAIIQKQEDGSFDGLLLDELDPDVVGGLTVFSGARSGLLGDEDLKQAADAMEPGTTAALLLYENTWAIPFVAAAYRAGGQVIASARIPAQDLMDALDALDATGA